MSKPATKLSLVEDAKRRAAFQAVNEHFDPSFTHVGIGSGSTVQYVVEAIVEKTKQQTTHHRTLFVPTGYQSRSLVDGAGLTSITFESLGEKQVLDVAFDGADEVDEELNCIKGGGACLFQEKLVATKAKKFVCVAGMCDVQRVNVLIMTSTRFSERCGQAAYELGVYSRRGCAHRSQDCDDTAKNLRLL